MMDFRSQTIESLWPQHVDVDYWRKLCPGLTIGNTEDHATSTTEAFSGAQKERQQFVREGRERLVRDGYFQLSPNDMGLAVSPDVLAEGMRILRRNGWPVIFILMYDEAWQIIQKIDSIMRDSTGCSCNFDILAWYVDPSAGESGFSPHRDRQPEDVPSSFRENGTPRYATCWLALTKACPDNSCLYMLPAWADPGYMSGDLDDKDPLERALSEKEKYMNIRCLPTDPAGACIFTHRIIHWGSQGRQEYTEPRLALAVACSDYGFEPSYLSTEYLKNTIPTLEERMTLCASQVIVYQDRFLPDKAAMNLFVKLHTQGLQYLSKFYRQKVSLEIVAGFKRLGDDSDSDDDEFADAALEAMLEADAAGEYQEDDFDNGIDAPSENDAGSEEVPPQKRQKVAVDS